MKKRIQFFLVCIMAVIFATNVFASAKRSEINNENEIYQKLPIVDVQLQYGIHIENINELEELSDIIVEATVLPNRTNVAGRYSGYTRTELEIKKVHYGDINEGDTIVIREPFVVLKMYKDVLDLTSEKEDVLLCYDGYRPSEIGETYLFFLEHSLYSDSVGEEQYGFLMSNISRYNIPNNNVARAAYNPMTQVKNMTTKDLGIAPEESFGSEIYRSIYTEILEKYYQ